MSSNTNKVHTVVDGRSNTTTYNYDAPTGNLLNIQRPMVGGLTPTVTYTYNGRGQVLTHTDETGIVTKYNFDTTTEELLSKVADFGISPHLNLTTQYGYNTVGDVTSMIDARSNTTTFLVDLLRRTTQKTDPTPFSYVTKWTYDDNNQLIKIERQTGDALNPWQTTSVAYSLTGKRTTVTDPSSNVFTQVYDTADRLWKLTDAENRTYQATYDARNRISQVTDPTLVVAEARTYTLNGRLYQLTDASGNTTTYSSDGFDRPDRETFPDSSYEEQQSYDGNSNVLTFRMRSGNTIVNTYDVLNRLATRTPQGQPVVTLTYDLAGRLLKSNKPVVAGDPSTGDFQYFYDSAGRTYEEQYPDAKTVVHVLDNNGNITKTTWPDAYFVDRIYDQLNRLTDIKLNGAGGASAANFQYDPLTRRTTLTLSNGVVTTYSYELDDDAASLLHTFNGSNVGFTYGSNKVHQLTSQNVSDGLFVWHPAAAGTTVYGTANNLNQYPTVAGITQSYNTSGCLTGDGTWTFGYDTENHMLTATETGTSASYVYDPMHRQAQKVVGSAKTRYIYSGWQRIADYDGVANTLQNRYVHGTDMDEPIIQVSSAGTLTFFHQERQGSVVALTNGTGVVSNRYSYSPFGESAVMTGITFGYQGQRFDAETGLYYYKARHYSPKLGRFLQPDSIGYRGGFNLYTYVLNDPLNRTDPYGLAPTTNPQQNKFIPGGGGVSLPPPDAVPPDVNGFSYSPPPVPAPILIFDIHFPTEGWPKYTHDEGANRPTIHMADDPNATPPESTPPEKEPDKDPTPPKEPEKEGDKKPDVKPGWSDPRQEEKDNQQLAELEQRMARQKLERQLQKQESRDRFQTWFNDNYWRFD